MTERLSAHQTHDITELAGTPLEAAIDLSQVGAQLQDAIIDFTTFEVQIAMGESGTPQTLREKYDLSYDPEKTVRSLGGLGLLITPQEYLRKEALEKSELTR